MADLDISSLLNTMTNVLLAVMEFTISFAPIYALSIVFAWLFNPDKETFWKSHMPPQNVRNGFWAFFVVAHCAVTFFLTLVWINKASALTIILYSTCSIWAVALGFYLGAFALAMVWVAITAVSSFFTGPKADDSAKDGQAYEPLASADNQDLEAGTDMAQIAQAEPVKNEKTSLWSTSG